MNVILKTGLLAAVIATSLSAMAAEPAPSSGSEPGAEANYLRTSYRINPDGSYTERHETSITVLDEQAADAGKHRSFSYNADQQTGEVLEAYTLKADGRRIDVPKRNYQFVSSQGNGGEGPVFSDEARVELVFPELAAGDTAVLSYLITSKSTALAGNFSTIEGFHKSVKIKQGLVSFDAPADMKVRHQAWNLVPERDEVVGTRRITAWSFQNLLPVADSPLPVLQEPQHAAEVHFSSFKGYAEVGDTYRRLVQPKLRITPRIQALADKIVGSQSEPRQIARRLYHWVSTNITYQSNDTGMGGYVPHDLDYVLDNAMGDCKDHATLLQVLLKAKGIESSQALIDYAPAYELPPVASMQVFNHVINYVPALDLYMDSTDTGVPFGFLPVAEAGKPVWLVDLGKQARTPVIEQRANQQVSTTRFTVSAAGDIEGEVATQAQGVVAGYSASGFRAVADGDYDKRLREGFASMGTGGTGWMEYVDDPAQDNPSLRFKVHFKVSGALPAPGATPLFDVSQSQGSVATFVEGWNGQPAPAEGVMCLAGSSREDFEITFDPGLEIVATPKDVSLTGPHASYTARYSLKDNVLKASRLIESHAPGPRCDQAYARAYGTFAEQVLSDLRSQVVYRPR